MPPRIKRRRRSWGRGRRYIPNGVDIRHDRGGGGHHEGTNGWNCEPSHPQDVLNKTPPKPKQRSDYS